MTYKAKIKITKDELQLINRYLNHQPKTEEECLSEDETIVHTAKFENGYEVDVKCCGVQFYEGENNCAWTEAVLFNPKGVQEACTEPESEYEGEWILNTDEDDYIVNVTTK